MNWKHNHKRKITIQTTTISNRKQKKNKKLYKLEKLETEILALLNLEKKEILNQWKRGKLQKQINDKNLNKF